MRVAPLIAAVALTACGNPSVESVAIPDTQMTTWDGPPEPGTYPKPMVPMNKLLPEPNAYYATNDSWRNQQPGVYGITASPGMPHIAGAEFEEQGALIIAWTGSFGDVTAEILRAARTVTDVVVLHDGAAAKSDFRSQMSWYGVSTSGVDYMDVYMDSIWARDFGPISIRDVKSKRVALVDPRYYVERAYDDAIPTQMAEAYGMNAFRMPVDFEAGNFMTDGRGTCFVTDSLYWVNQLSRTDLEYYFRQYLGCYQLVILEALDGEVTGHIDMFAKVVDRNTVVIGDYSASDDPYNAAVLDRNAAKVRNVRNASGTKFDVVRIPMPSNWDYNYRTYVNTQFINGKNLIPIYSDDDRFEAEALRIWRDVLPSYQHIAIDSTELITWAGAIHCILKEIEDAGTWTKFQSDPDLLCERASCYPNSSAGFNGCGVITAGGRCSGGDAQWCEQGVTKETNCTSSCKWQGTKGRFGCSGSTSSTSSAPSTPDPVEPDPVEPDPADDPLPSSGCGVIDGAGCCTGSTLVYCTTAETLEELSCSGGCGWDASGNDGWGWYDCGNSGSDPSGEYPRSCGG